MYKGIQFRTPAKIKKYGKNICGDKLLHQQLEREQRRILLKYGPIAMALFNPV
jgi:hypothetical protein